VSKSVPSHHYVSLLKLHLEHPNLYKPDWLSLTFLRTNLY